MCDAFELQGKKSAFDQVLVGKNACCFWPLSASRVHLAESVGLVILASRPSTDGNTAHPVRKLPKVDRKRLARLCVARMEVVASSSSSAMRGSVDSDLSRKTSSSGSGEDGASTSAREWKKLFAQIQATSSTSANTTTRSHARAELQPRRGRGSSTSARSSRHGWQAPRSDPSSSSSSVLPLIPTSSSDPLSRIRHQILTTPLPPDTSLSPTSTTYRSIVWKLLLDIPCLDIATYLSLVAKGKSPSHEKIRNDTFRTLATDQGFKERVKEEKLIRLLDAFVWKHFDDEAAGDGQAEAEAAGYYEFSYVQGMNVLAAPFLYACQSEVEAFRCFARFIEYCCPLYVQPTLAGVHRGLQVSHFLQDSPPIHGFVLRRWGTRLF